MPSVIDRRPLLLLAVAVAVAVLLGCAGETPEEEAAFQAEPAVPAPQTETPAPLAGEGETIQVTLTEYAIEMPASVPAGPTMFHIRNVGSVEHNFEIEGQGIEEELPEDLAPGASATLQVDLQPGTYTVYCPVGDHQGRGMQTTLTVEPAADVR